MTSTAHSRVESSRVVPGRIGAALLTETGLARLALGIAALHVVDDNFLQPQPGTSAADHLAGGLVQTGLLVLFAWAYPRLRPGLRGTLAIFVGLFVIVMGVGEAGYYTRENGPSGDDYTGLLAIPAGFLLIGIGLMTLWKSRKGGSVVRRYLRRALLTVGFLLGAYVVVYPVSEMYVVTHAARAYVPTPQLGAPYEDVAFTTSDGLRLEGWYVPTKNGATVIVIPGRKGPQKPARMLVQHGYGVLLFDRRGEGESEGDPNGLGWAGTRDVQAAISFLAGSARGRRRPHRRARPLGRRRGASAGGGRDGRPAGGRLGGRGHPLRPRGGGAARAGLLDHHRRDWTNDGGDGCLHERPAATEPQGSQRRDRGAGVLHLRHARAGRREPHSDLLRGGEASPRSSGPPKAGTPARSMPSHRSTSGESSASSMTR